MKIKECQLEFEASDVAVMPWLLDEMEVYANQMGAFYHNDHAPIIWKMRDVLVARRKNKKGKAVITLTLHETKRLKYMLKSYMHNGVGPGYRAAHHLLASYIESSLSLT